jgi:hypothetical protein
MNLGTKIPSKLLANKTQECMKRIIRHGKVGFIPDMRGCHVNKLKQKNHDFPLKSPEVICPCQQFDFNLLTSRTIREKFGLS